MIALLALGLFVGCEKIEGDLTVEKDFNLKNSETRGLYKIPAGSYHADMKFTRSKMTLRLNNNNNEKFEFNRPRKDIPDNGSFTFKSAELGQPVDLSGDVHTVRTTLGHYSGWEFCEYDEPVQVCYPLPTGGQSCHIEYRRVRGQQYVKYHVDEIDRDIRIDIAQKDQAERSGSFASQSLWREKIYDSQGICR